jgi:hypothetical protein
MKAVIFMLPAVDFFGTRVSRLILGDNPFNGHSYVADKAGGAEMLDFYTEDKVIETLFYAEELGMNTWLPLADPFIIRCIRHYKNMGGRMNVIFQTCPWYGYEQNMNQLMECGPIAFYHQGSTTDYLWETGQLDELKRIIALYRTKGLPIGIGTHYPEVIRQSEEENWGVDFYMACLHNARRNRAGEQSGFITGKSKQGLIFAAEDRPVMLETIRQTAKPVLAFKIFAGGQMFTGKSDEEIQALLRTIYREVYSGIKPGDLAVMGVFQRDKDELGEDMRIAKEVFAELS